MREEKWIRWLGVVAALVALSILIFSRDLRDVIVGSKPDEKDVLVYLAIGLFPAFAAVFLSAFARFWWTFSLGLCLLFVSVVSCIDTKASSTAILFVLAAATLCVTPFLNKVCRPKESGTNEDAQPTDSGDKQ